MNRRGTTVEAFSKEGFAIVPEVLTPAECEYFAALVDRGSSIGDRRLLAAPWCGELAQRLQKHPILSRFIPIRHVAVQCTYFEKSPVENWLVAFHQDLSIPVRQKVDGANLSGWSEKDGTLFVHGPVEVLQQMLAVRLHLDVCGAEDGPLRVIPGSHLSGRIASSAVPEFTSAARETECVSEAGAALLMRPLLLHASSKTRGVSRRRVLHFVYGPPTITCGLQWKYAA